jgi:4-hydroxyphenylacetate 3-monooxygenase
MSIKDGKRHLQSIKDGRTVYIDGKLAGDVTQHPAFRNAVQSTCALYDFQAHPDHQELMTFDVGNGRRVNRCWEQPRSYEQLVQRRKALVTWAEQHHGFMGRSPDHVASALAGQHMGIEVFRKHGEQRASALDDYFHYARDNDLFLTYVIINPQANRAKDWGEQNKLDGGEDLVAAIVDEDGEGITIRGAKMLGTSSIMANEVFVANLQPLKKGEERLAFSCALPMNSRGLKVLSRKSYEAHAVSEYDNPLSSRFDENDALMYFDDVKVPWDRVFVHRDTDMCRAQFHDTPGHTMQNYQAQMRLSVKLRFLTGVARRIADTIGTSGMPAVAEQLGMLAAKSAMVESMMWGMEAAGYMWGDYYMPNKHMMYTAQVITQDLYPQFINTIRNLAGGSLIMLPSSVEDMLNPELAGIVRKTQVSQAMGPDSRVKFLKLAWDAIGSEFASRHLQYEMFYAGAQFVTCGHSFRTYDWNGATSMTDALMNSYSTPGVQEQAARKVANA